MKDTSAAMKMDVDFNRVIRSLMRERPAELSDDAFRHMFTAAGFERSTYARREDLKEKLHNAERRMAKRGGMHSFTLIDSFLDYSH
jgi:hypothetical protein